MRDHDPINIEDFNGLWARGDAEPCPIDHFTESLNIQFIESGYKTRDGLTPANPTNANTLRFYPWFDAGNGLDGYLELRSDNKIYHIFGSVNSWTTFQVSNAITGMTDFLFISIGGRAYISPSQNTNLGGLPGEFLYVYDGGGVNMMRKAAGTAPTTAEGALAVVDSGTAGNIEAGIHVLGVVYETNSGFLTQIGPDTLPTWTASGTKKAAVTAIPIFGGGGGSLITKRHLVASVSIPIADYNGDPKSYQLFFVPGGVINDNTTTTATINFFDSELVADASHLLNLLSSIPAVGSLNLYHNRLVAANNSSGNNVALVSYAGEPEAFDAINGLIVVPREGTGITTTQQYRDILYVGKFNRIIAFNDNGDVPSSWPSTDIDQGLGWGKHGISLVGWSGGTNIESFITLNDQGIYIFTGTLTTPELSYKIKDFWATIPFLDIINGKVSAFTDPVKQILVINIPSLNTLLIGDYTNGLSAEKIKWTKWTFGAVPNTIMFWDKDNKLFVGMPTGDHYILAGTTSDTINGSGAVKIPDPTATTALLPVDGDDIYHYGGARIRVVGSGNLIPKYYSLDGTLTQVLASIVLSATPGKEPFVLANILSQKARLELKTSVINETFKVNKLTLFTKLTYSSYPQ